MIGIKTVKKVNIILPAYNGEKYIGDQIESLLDQTYSNIDIYIRDDRSRDNTVNVIRSYIGKEPVGKKIILIDNNDINWGYVRNVFDTWKLTDPADYYCFCDQDDVWHKDKVEKSVALLESKGTDKPALCFTGFNFCDSELRFMRASDPVPEPLGLRNVCYDFLALNFNIMVNHSFRETFFANLPLDGSYPNYPDFWMSQVAACYGRLYCLQEATVEYRRQEQAASFSNHNQFSFFLWRFKMFFMSDETKKISKDLNDLFSVYKSVLSESDKKNAENFYTEECCKLLSENFLSGSFEKKKRRRNCSAYNVYLGYAVI